MGAAMSGGGGGGMGGGGRGGMGPSMSGRGAVMGPSMSGRNAGMGPSMTGRNFNHRQVPIRLALKPTFLPQRHLEGPRRAERQSGKGIEPPRVIPGSFFIWLPARELLIRLHRQKRRRLR
jgi:hypothetical protein